MMLGYIIVVILMMLSLYSLISAKNLFRKTIALGILQTAILLFFILLARVKNSNPPILKCLDLHQCPQSYSDPVPHVLMLTAIVVGLATLAVALSLLVRIKEAYGSIDEDDLKNAE